MTTVADMTKKGEATEVSPLPNALDFYIKALNFNVISRYDSKIKQLLFHTPHASVYKWDFSKDEWRKLEYQGVLAIYLRDISDSNAMLPVEEEKYGLDVFNFSYSGNKGLPSSGKNISEMNSSNNNTNNNGVGGGSSSSGSSGGNASIGDSTGNMETLTGRDIYNYGLIILNRLNPDNFSMGIVPNSVVHKRKVFNAAEDKVNRLECMGIEVREDLLIIKNLKCEVYGLWIHTVADRKNVYELIKYLLESEPKDSFA